MKTLAERLAEARNEAGMSQGALAKLAGCGQSTIASVERGRNQGSTVLPRLAEILGVSALWLAEGRGPKRPTHPPTPPFEPRTPSDEDYSLIPHYSARAACGPAYHNGHVELLGGLAFRRDWLARAGLRPETLSVISANGDSMAPTIDDGDALLINHAECEPKDGQVYALARGDEMIVKRLVRDFGGGWIVRSDNLDNSRYGDFHVSSADVRVVGRVVWRGGGL